MQESDVEIGNVPFADLKRMRESVRVRLHQAACRVIDSGHFIGGEEVKGFEREMAQWLGVHEVCGVSCATMGLYTVLKCAGVGPGDEVVTTPHTAIATAEAITMAGAQIVFADIEQGLYTLDPRAARAKISPRTRAIIPVHLYGQPTDMKAFLELARQYKLLLIEDCAQAQGAKYQDQFVGTLGDAAVYSFFPSKTLGGFGDGGAVVAKDEKLASKIRMFANHGRTSKYLHEFEGTNSRLDAIQAAMLRVCLPELDEWNRQRRETAEWYREELAEVTQIRLPKVRPDVEHVFHVYVILTPQRDLLQKYLKEHGVETGIHYPYALNVLPAYERLNQGRGSFPVAEECCDQALSLPLFPSITRAEVARVGQAVREYFKYSS
jgi:dTDP-4-amino-4,6-dideoxygalactose transaminase